MKTIEMPVGLLSDEEQKEFDFIDGKFKRRSIVYPYERARYKELHRKAEQTLINKRFKKDEND